MKNIDIVAKILKREFDKNQTPVVDLIQIQTKDPFKVLVATILSARTNDLTTSKACERLFAVVNKLDDLRTLNTEELEKLVYPVGFYKNKVKFLKELPYAVEREFNGKIPYTVEELIKLPGVGRKTANLVVAIAFDKPAICVDVHVHRISNRLGYVKTKTPLETEMALRKDLPLKYWKTINSYLVSFGQNLCRPINPHCNTCPIYDYCKRIGVKTKYTKK